MRAFGTKTATADSSLDDNTKIYIECQWKGLSSSQRIFIWMSHAKLPGVSALSVIISQISRFGSDE
jgi:hypothetical protein